MNYEALWLMMRLDLTHAEALCLAAMMEPL